MKKLLGYRRIILVLIDIALYILSAGAMLLYLSRGGRAVSLSNFAMYYGILALILIVFRFISGVYSCVWRYVVLFDYIRVVLSDLFSGVVFYALYKIVFNKFIKEPGEPVFIVCVVAVSLIAVLCSRFFYQFVFMKNESRRPQKGQLNRIPIAIIGAGKTGALLAESLQTNEKSRYIPYCFFDVDLNKVGKTVKGVKVYPADENVAETIAKMPVKEIVITVSSLGVEEKKKLFDIYEKTGLPIKIYDLPLERADEVGVPRRIRDFSIEDLLFRDAINIQTDTIRHFFTDKVIMVTGGGGSIGSELCRQIASLSPRQLVIVDIYENNAYDIQQELIRKYGSALTLSVEIASVRDAEKIRQIMQKYHPAMVFHAAAHKHVPLMEDCCDEAIKNNVFGTYNVANAAEEAGVERFIMISTDKAVNPTNVMGASKRMCEMIVQSRRDSKTRFAAVRFGNVLGSNGSVIPLFRRQIEAGGPVTVTDKRVIRYFMTIPEAVQLVMQAGVIASQGDIFVLDMGRPVKILELAENMIKLSGFKPYSEIDITEIGLRPGEKLYEELLVKSETLDKTASDKIFIERDSPIERDEVEDKLAALREALKTKDSDTIRRALKQTVPTFHSPEEVNGCAERAEEMKLAGVEF